MAIVRLTKGGVYAPEIAGNEKLPEDEQVRFHWRHLTAQERKDFVTSTDTGKRRKDGTPVMIFDPDMDGLFRAMTIKIEHLQVQVDGGEVEEIDTAAKLLSYPGGGVLWDYMDEAATEYLKQTLEASRELRDLPN